VQEGAGSLDRSIDLPGGSIHTARAREGTVLFADMIGISNLYAAAGDLQAVGLIARCRNGLRDVVQAEGGRVLRTMGERLLALLSAPDSAALAATRMHLAVEALPPHAGVRLGLKVAFHHGSLIQREDEVFGDTVDATSRMLDAANKGQTLLSSSCLPSLSPAVRACVRRLGGEPDGSSNAPLELAWRQSPDVTYIGERPPSLPQPVLRLTYKGQTIVRRRANEALLIGRDESCDVVVQERKASRQHCTIERKANGFVLRDHSSNGTYVKPADDLEMIVLQDELTLRGAGLIAFGQPLSETPEPMEYGSQEDR